MHTHIKHNIKMALLTLTEHFHTASPIPFYKKPICLKITLHAHSHTLSRAHTQLDIYILRDIDQTK